MIEGRNGLYKVTGLLDWDSVLSAFACKEASCMVATAAGGDDKQPGLGGCGC